MGFNVGETRFVWTIKYSRKLLSKQKKKLPTELNLKYQIRNRLHRNRVAKFASLSGIATKEIVRI